jgi:hypothetical protein
MVSFMKFGQSVEQVFMWGLFGAIAAGLLVTYGIGNIVGHERPEFFGMLAAVPGAIVGGVSASPGSRTKVGGRIAVAAGGLLTVFLFVAGFLFVDSGGVLVPGLGTVLLVVFESFMVAAICGLWIGTVLSRRSR